MRGLFKSLAAFVVLGLIVAFLSLHAQWIDDGIPVSTAIDNVEYHQAVGDGLGGMIITWMNYGLGPEDIYAQRINKFGYVQWTINGEVICDESEGQAFPQLVSDGSGGSIITWMDWRSDSRWDVYAQRIDSSGTTRWQDNGVRLCYGGFNEESPQIASDGTGGAIITWQDSRSGSNWDIYVQRVADGRDTIWSPYGAAVCTASGDQIWPNIIPDGGGGAIIAWLDGRAGDNEIYAQRIDTTGAADWAPDGIRVFSSGGGQIGAIGIVSDGSGGAIISWDDDRNFIGVFDVYAQRIDFSGSVLWDSAGVAICTDMYNQLGNTPVSDELGGAIIAWDDQRGGIYAQRVNGNGDIQWTSDGMRVCTGSDSQHDHHLAYCGYGEVIVTWSDNRNDTTDIYAQKLDINGNIKWSTDGVPICLADHYQSQPRIVSDGTGAAIVAWRDSRSGTSSDLYANTIPSICSMSADSLDFGTVVIGDYSERSFTLKNIGGWVLGGDAMESCDHYSIYAGGGSYSLNPHDSLVVVVRFEPDSVGTFGCAIETGDNSCSDMYCTGIGEPPPFCSVYPDSIDFGSVTVGHYKDEVFTVKNIGGGILAGSVEEFCGDFSVISGGGSYNLSGGDSVIVTVRFEPAWYGSQTCLVFLGYSCDTVWCEAEGDLAPIIHAIRDVPGDQGGYVNVAWDASPGDTSASHIITMYTIWRAIDPDGIMLLGEVPGMGGKTSKFFIDDDGALFRIETLANQQYYWKLVSRIGAWGLEGYSDAVPTLFDSTAVCSEYHYFQVLAHTSDSLEYWASAPDSGYSVDNLAPGQLMGLEGEQSFEPEGLQLAWLPNVDPDIQNYAVYRGLIEEFEPSSENLIASPSDTAFFDDEWRWDNQFYYKVAAFDVHGNEGPYGLLRPTDITGEESQDMPKATYLVQNFPNPFNPTTTIMFGLREAVYVTLRVYDASGRLVKVLVESNRDIGHHRVIWDGVDEYKKPVASGVYFYRLVAGDFVQTRKMVLLR